jgi:carbon starvation protein
MTPAVRHNDGLDYVPTDKKVLFGHHFAAIAGAGPLVGRCWRRRWAICRG